MRSVLGREFLALQSERNKQKQLFESAPQKMAADTLSYRRAEIALGRFLDDMIPRITKANFSLLRTQSRLDLTESKAKDKIQMSRQDAKIIWHNFATERYQILVDPYKATFKKYHPSLLQELDNKWNVFEKELDRWVFGGQPFDGSQAMSTMIDFQIQCRLLAAHND